MLTTKQILKAIDCPYLKLYRAPEGYFYFVYANDEKKVWLDESVYVYRLNHMTLDLWVSYGKEFVAECEDKEE